MPETRIGQTVVRLLQGDITIQDVDAIVNAANPGLLGGGGVDGAIHHAGGPEILDECKAIRAARGVCPAGEAVITTGGRLKAGHVIHTVGPVWQGGKAQEDQILKNAYRNSLHLAVLHSIRTIAFPSISTGIYGFPVERASRIAFDTVAGFVRSHPQIAEVRFIAFSNHDFRVYETLFSEMNAAL